MPRDQPRFAARRAASDAGIAGKQPVDGGGAYAKPIRHPVKRQVEAAGDEEDLPANR